MKVYPEESNGTNPTVSVEQCLELAKKAKVDSEPWVQRALLAVILTDDVILAEALSQRLKILSAVEELDPYHFSRPSEEDFLA